MPLTAQATRTLTGTAVDSAGEPLRKSWVCTLLPTGPASFLSRCAEIDSLGHYSLDSLPRDHIEVLLACNTIGLLGKRLQADTIPPGDTPVLHRDFIVSTVGCDHRPVRQVKGIFRGHYTPGFESSDFIPCADNAWFLPGDSLDAYRYDARRAWVEWPNAPANSISQPWPNVPGDSYGNPRYYVRWMGTVVGPGVYGHLGGSPFEFRVDSLLEVRRPSEKDCQ